MVNLVSNKIVGRQKLKDILAKSSPSILEIEGCESSHYWRRLADSFGHDVRISQLQYIREMGFIDDI